jgi:hypothetical protein
LAEAGEVFVSRAVVDLVIGSGIQFSDDPANWDTPEGRSGNARLGH